MIRRLDFNLTEDGDNNTIVLDLEVYRLVKLFETKHEQFSCPNRLTLYTVSPCQNGIPFPTVLYAGIWTLP